MGLYEGWIRTSGDYLRASIVGTCIVGACWGWMKTSENCLTASTTSLVGG